MSAAPVKPKRKQFGVHVRAVMSDPRWSVLPLSARAAWMQLTDLGDVMPELRAPMRNRTVTLADMARLLGADPDELGAAVAQLVQRDILEPVAGGYRLKAY